MLSNQGTSNQIEFYNRYDKPYEKECRVIDIDIVSQDFRQRGKTPLQVNNESKVPDGPLQEFDLKERPNTSENYHRLKKLNETVLNKQKKGFNIVTA